MYRLLFSLFLAAGQCPPSSTILASSDLTKVESSPGVYTSSAIVSSPPIPPWVTLPGARWIWERDGHTAGEFTFVDTFTLEDWALAAGSSVKLFISADNFYSVTLNEVVVAEQWQGNFSIVDQYELKSLVLASSVQDGIQINTLKIEGKNLDGPGGVLFLLVVEYENN